MASFASAALAGACLVMLTALLAVDPRNLDPQLHWAVVFLAVALPFLFASATLAYFRVAPDLAYWFLGGGASALTFAIWWVIAHLDLTAGLVFVGAFMVSGALVGRTLTRKARAEILELQQAQHRQPQAEAPSTEKVD
jgi:hypothetical protein